MRTVMKPLRMLLALLSVAIVVTSYGGSEACAQDRNQGRSMVISRNGIVAAESPLAAQAGVQMLERGGNAVDAAVAANAMMGLIAPMNDGIGGDLFAIVYDAKSGKLYGLNASGWAPAGLTVDYLLAKGIKQMPQRGINSVTVPGAVEGWDELRKRFGSKTFSELLAPAIAYAENGFPVGEVVSVYWRDSVKILNQDEPTAKTYLPGGHAPQAGEVFRDPDLAVTYRQIAANGKDAFYKGEIAKRILATSASHGGTMKPADLAEYEAE